MVDAVPDSDDDPFDDPFDLLDLDRASDAIVEVLSAGPLRDDALLAALRAHPAYEEVADVDDDELAEVVEDLVPPGIWRTASAIWFDAARTLDGRTFTHRVTPTELAEGALEALPDLTLVDWSCTRRELPGGGVLASSYTPGDVLSGGRFDGPSGWLGEFAAGNVVAIRIVGDAASVESLDPSALPDVNSTEVLELARAFRECFDRASGSLGEDLTTAALDVLIDVPDAFLSPTLPLSELATAAGLVSRGLQWGPGDRRWLTTAQAMIRQSAEDLVSEDPPHFARRFLRLVDVFVDLIGEPETPLDPTVRAATRRDLTDPFTAESMADLQRQRLFIDDSLARFVDVLGGVGEDEASPFIRHLLGVDALLSGRYDEAESHLLAAVQDADGLRAALCELGVLASHRGNAVEAQRRFHEAGGPAQWIAALDLLVPRSNATGRNDPCVCGSGRKFKQCCLVAPKSPIERRGPWYSLRLINHVSDRSTAAIDTTYRIVAEDAELHGVQLDINAVAMLTALAIDGPADYLSCHADSISDVDRVGFEAWRDAPVRAYSTERTKLGWTLDDGAGTVLEVADDGRLVVDAATGRTAAQVVPLGDASFVAWSAPLSAVAEDELSELLRDEDARTSLREWAYWYGSTLAR